MKIKEIIFHCSDSDFGDAELIKKWHIDPVEKGGRGWKNIGYHGVILNGKRSSKDEIVDELVGIFEEGRALNLNKEMEPGEIGAHVLNHNQDTVGICLIGKNKFEIKQFETAIYFAKLYLRINPDIVIKGHYEMDTAGGKTCPNFNMDELRSCIYDTASPIRLLIENKFKESLKG